MNNIRLWVTILGAVCFLVGVSTGLLAARLSQEPEPAEGAFAYYRENLVAHFDLSPEREVHLRVIIDHYQKEIDAIRDEHTQKFMSSMEPALLSTGLEYRQMIRDRVLPERDRAEFDRLCSSYLVASNL